MVCHGRLPRLLLISPFALSDRSYIPRIFHCSSLARYAPYLILSTSHSAFPLACSITLCFLKSFQALHIFALRQKSLLFCPQHRKRSEDVHCIQKLAAKDLRPNRSQLPPQLQYQLQLKLQLRVSLHQRHLRERTRKPAFPTTHGSRRPQASTRRSRRSHVNPR